MLWGLVAVVTSFPAVRGVLIWPLHRHTSGARGEIAYVMADGPATWERLHAASDLYHMRRVKEIWLLEQLQTSTYNFVRRRNDSRLQREIDFLAMRGVPETAVRAVPMRHEGWLSSLSEARDVAEEASQQVSAIVVVTSPPHTRRSELCFRRVFGDRAQISIVSSNAAHQSTETHFPIWIEYVKLLVYWLVA